MKKPNEWTIRFGAIRKAKDKALLAALEREIADEEKLRAAEAKLTHAEQQAHMKRRASLWPDENSDPKAERERIARAFGRPA